MTPEALDSLRSQFAALAERKIAHMSAIIADAPRMMRRYKLDACMEKLLEWRHKLNTPAGRVSR